MYVPFFFAKSIVRRTVYSTMLEYFLKPFLLTDSILIPRVFLAGWSTVNYAKLLGDYLNIIFFKCWIGCGEPR